MPPTPATALPSPAPPSPLFVACSTEERYLATRVRRWLRYRRSLLSLVGDIDFLLSQEHATGTLTLHYSQGTVAVAEFRQESILTLDPLSAVAPPAASEDFP